VRSAGHERERVRGSVTAACPLSIATIGPAHDFALIRHAFNLAVDRTVPIHERLC